jgi:hypothetical protein
VWQDTLTAWRQDPNMDALLRIEADLRDKDRIIGERRGMLTIDLSEQSKTTANNIFGYTTRLKNALGKLKLVLSDAGAEITYDATSQELNVPHALAETAVIPLAGWILDALVGGLNYDDDKDRSTPRLNTHKRAIIDLLFDNDRPAEHEQLLAFQLHVEAVNAPPPTMEAWRSARTDLDLAVVADIADRWKVTADRVIAATEAMRKNVEKLDETLAPDVTRAKQIGARLLSAGITDAQNDRRSRAAAKPTGGRRAGGAASCP